MLRVLFRCFSFLHWGIRPWVIRNRAACAHLLGLCCFLPPVLAAFPGALSLLLLLASACFLPSRPCSHLAFTARVSACVCFFVLFVLLFWPFVVFCLVLLVLSSCCVDVFLCCAWCQLTEVTKDCRVLPASSSHTHTRQWTSSLPSRIIWRLACPWIRLLVCLSWLSCGLVPLARLSCSVRGVGNSRPEPWTRLHCSELHWRDPVALSVGQPGAPVSSKACAHGSWVSFSESMVSSWPTRWVSGVCSGFHSWTPWLRRCNALQVLYWDEDTREAPEQFCSSAGYFPTWRPVTVHVWAIALQLRPQAGSYTMFCWLCMLWQDCSPLRPGTVFMSTQWRTWLVADHDWSPTLLYVTVLDTATELLPAGGAVQ